MSGHIGTGINAFFSLTAAVNEVKPNEYFLGFQLTGVSLQDLLDNYDLTLASGEIPVLSVAVVESSGRFRIDKYFAQIPSGAAYSPLGNYVTEKELILMKDNSPYPSEQSADAALEAVNAQVLDFSVASIAEVITELNTSISPIDISNEAVIYYFRFDIAGSNYIYVISEDTVRGIYGAGNLQFISDDLILFYSPDEVNFYIEKSPISPFDVKFLAVFTASDYYSTSVPANTVSAVIEQRRNAWQKVYDNTNTQALSVGDNQITFATGTLDGNGGVTVVDDTTAKLVFPFVGDDYLISIDFVAVTPATANEYLYVHFKSGTDVLMKSSAPIELKRATGADNLVSISFSISATTDLNTNGGYFWIEASAAVTIKKRAVKNTRIVKSTSAQL